MIASMILKRIITSNLRKLEEDDPDVDAITAGYHDDITWDISSEIGVGQTIKGKKALAEWLTRWKEEFPKRKYDVKNICYSAWPLSLKNVITVQYTLTQTDKQGKTFKWDAVSVFHIRNFKPIHASDYISFAGLPKLSTLIEPSAED